jgi:hypothetical protein
MVVLVKVFVKEPVQKHARGLCEGEEGKGEE